MKDLICHRCFEQTSEYLLYFQKTFPNNRKGLYHPALLCKQCADNQRMSNVLFESRPVLVSFLQIAKAKMPIIMWLCSDKGKDYNDMGYPVWRNKLLRIKKYAEGRFNSPVLWMRMPL